MKNYYLFFLILFANLTAVAQPFTLTENSEISILTIGPGDNLYDKFGHSAFRVQDETTNLDLVFNYGVYDFDTPNFYTKFARGQLLYKLAVSEYEDFLATYIIQERWIKEQLLDLNYQQKNELFSFLLNNAKPENQYYKYDFFYDNCATRIRDVLKTVLGEDLNYKDDLAEEGCTFRELIQKNVHWNSWGSMGMDAAIGAVVDRKASSWHYQFLPDYVFKAAKDASLTTAGAQKPLVKQTTTIYEGGERDGKGSFFLSPLFVFGILGLLLIGVTIQDARKKRRSRYLDAAIFLITGAIGVILLLLWVATDHSTTANNYNLLWAFPLSLFLFPLIAKKQPKRWLKRYVFFLPLLIILLFTHWLSGVQVFALAMLPLFIGLAIRYGYVYKFLDQQGK